jgi:class 3 adenylate cyclase
MDVGVGGLSANVAINLSVNSLVTGKEFGVNFGRPAEVKDSFAEEGDEVACAASARDRLAKTAIRVAGDQLLGISDGVANLVHVKSFGHGIATCAALS